MRTSVPRLLLSASLLCLSACGFPKTGAVPPAVGPSDVGRATAKWPDVTPEALNNGRALFSAKCNACHGYPDVATIPEAKWPEIMDRMAPNAKLDAAQKEAVLRFVIVSRPQP